MSGAAGKRIAKEIRSLSTKGLPAGLDLVSVSDNAGGGLPECIFGVRVLGNSVFEGEHFRLRVRFDQNYPFESPEVTFVTSPPWRAPMHPHIYTNGHICASILSDEWSPALSVEAILLTIQSMLASCKVRYLSRTTLVSMHLTPAAVQGAGTGQRPVCAHSAEQPQEDALGVSR